MSIFFEFNDSRAKHLFVHHFFVEIKGQVTWDILWNVATGIFPGLLICLSLHRSLHYSQSYWPALLSRCSICNACAFLPGRTIFPQIVSFLELILPFLCIVSQGLLPRHADPSSFPRMQCCPPCPQQTILWNEQYMETAEHEAELCKESEHVACNILYVILSSG